MAAQKKGPAIPSTDTLFQPFAPLLDHATDGIHILDPQGILVASSLSFAEMLGFTRLELLGRHVSSWDAHLTSAELADIITRTLSLPPGNKFFFESLHRRKDGSTLPVEIHAAQLLLGDHRFCIYSSRDISERLANEKRLCQLTQFTELLAKLNRKILLARDREMFFQEICDLAISETRIPLAWIGRPGEDGYFEILARSGEAVGYLDRVKVPGDPQKCGIHGPSWQALTSGTPLVNENLGRFFQGSDSPLLQRYIEAFADYGLDTFVSLPVREEEDFRYIFSLYQHEANVFSQEILTILQEIVQGITLGLSRIKARTADQRNRSIREALLDNTLAGILLVKNRTIVEANRRLAEILGYDSPQELAGLSTRVLYYDEAEYFRIGALLYPRVTQETHIRLGELHGLRKDGSDLWVETSATTTVVDGEPLTVITMQDVTLRHRQSSRLARLSDFTSFFARANQLLADTQTFEETASSLCKRACEIPGVLLCSIDDETASPPKTIAISGSADILPETLQQSLLHTMSRNGDTPHFIATDTLPGDFFQDFPAPVKSLGILPLFRENSHFGYLLLIHRESDIFDSEVRSILEELGRNISRTLDRLAITERERLLSAALAAVSEGATVTDSDGKVLYANNAFTQITGYSLEETRGRTLNILQGPGTNHETIRSMKRALLDKEEFQGQILNYTKRGKPFWNLLTTSPMRNKAGEVLNFVGVMRDISEIRALTDQLEHQALHDPLTGLPNRRSLEIHLSRALARGQRNGTVTAVGILDLNDFKPVNDLYGHQAGDVLLRDFSKRAIEMLRDNDFLARLGGDEFVVVIEDLDPGRFEEQLLPLLSRLHRTVEVPFNMGQGSEATVGMTLGLALAPIDSLEADTLLRLADASMYRAKERKGQDAAWWQRGPHLMEPPSEEPFSAYGEEAARLLQKHLPTLRDLVERFVRDFYDRLAKDPEAVKILSSLSPMELASLRARQNEHLSFLLNPETTREGILASARRSGETHVLVGLEPSLLLQSKALYSNILVEHLTLSRLSPRDQYRIYLAADSRLQDDIREELRSGATVRGSYFEIFSHPLPLAGTPWIEGIRQEMTHTGTLPGLRCILLFRPDANGTFQIEGQAGSGSCGDLLMGALGANPVINPSHPRGQGLISQAFRKNQIAISPSVAQDPLLTPWHDALKKQAIRSAMAIPVNNSSGEVVAIVVLFGAYPNQFSSSWITQFAQSFRHRMEQAWALCNRPPEVISRETAERYRSELYQGGLSMYMQPVIDLRNGSCGRVEALARLVLPGGEVVTPDEFLPVLSGEDLNWLFREGLDQSLDQIASLEKEGIELDLCLNIHPLTLQEPQCSEWVMGSLKHHGISPSRLSLELLEDRSLDLPKQNTTLERLTSLGVGISMDDLGSGYSSIARLSSLSFDKIKVNQSLLAHIRTIPLETLGILGTIIQIGRELGYGVVVEGLEDPGMVEVAAILGARYGQGFSLGRPMPADRIPDWIRSRHQPPRPGKITSWIGALASHWQFMHREERSGSFPLEHCPLTTFFLHKQLDTSPQALWHAALHEGTLNREELGKKLTDWLVEKVCEEGLAGLPKNKQADQEN